MRVVLVSVIAGWLSLICTARGQTTVTAAAARNSATTGEARGRGGGVIDLGVANVRIEMYGWEEADRRFTPGAGLASGDGSMRDEMLSGRYQMALAGRWPAGSREVFGFVGGPYPNESDLKVVKFQRRDRSIDIVLLRLETGGKGDGYRSWKVAYVSALLPVDLPPGKYSVQCAILNVAGEIDPMSRATPQCDVEHPNPKEAQAKAAREGLKKLSDEQLVREYVAAARALGTGVLAPREAALPDVPGYELNDVKYRYFVEVGDEIVRRGKTMVPWLMEMLRRYAPATAGSKDPNPIGLARVLTELIVRINDPRSAPLLVEVVEGLDGKVIPPVRRSALEALERLTMVTFRRHTLVDGRSRWAVEAPRALPPDRNDPVFGASGPAGQAKMFREWLGGEGKDPGRWLELARQRARSAVEGKDIRAAYAAIEFLQNGDVANSRDDQPNQTMARIGEILMRARQMGVRSGNYDYQFDGRALPATINDWVEKLGYYGPKARPHASALIRIDEEIATPSGRRIDQMCRVGGEEIVRYLVRRLPELERRLAAADADARAFPDEVTEKRLAQLTKAVAAGKWAVARWSGRVFDSTHQMRAWWEENSEKSQGRWLRESLEVMAERADRGDETARKLIKVIVPEAPEKDCAKWLKERLNQLAYDEGAGCYRVDAKAFP